MMIHGNTITDGNGINFKRGTSSLTHSSLHRLSNASQVYMPRDNLAEAIHYAYKWLSQLCLGTSQGSQQGTMGSALYATLYAIASHLFVVSNYRNRPFRTSKLYTYGDRK
jgi:hypothetical protein